MQQLSVFFDGDCPLCRREIDWLRRRDVQGRVAFVDIGAPDFEASDYPRTQDELMAEIHGQRADGAWLTGVDLFAELYQLTGLPFLSWLFSNRLLYPLLNFSYRLFARNRLRLTGRTKCLSCDQIDTTGCKS